MKRKILFGIFIFVMSMVLIKSNIHAFNWSSGSIPYQNDTISTSEISKYRNNDGSDSDYKKQVDQVCLYDYGVENEPLYYLFIYTDGTASVGWDGSGCNRTGVNGKCVDGYNDDNGNNRGMRNWSKNSNGTKEKAVQQNDAYKKYQQTKKCPYFLYKAENYGANYFYLYDSVRDNSQVGKLAEEEPGSKVKGMYNVGESKTYTSDLKCQYSEDKEATDSDFDLTFKSNGYIDISDAKKYGNSLKIFVNMNSSQYLDRITADKCPKVIHALNTSNNNMYLMGDNEKLVGLEVQDTSLDWIPVAGPIITLFKKKKGGYQFYCIGENCSNEDICAMYDEFIQEIKEILSGYSGKSRLEQKSVLKDYYQAKDELNAYCLSALSNLNYSEGGCLDKCLHNAETLAGIEKENGLRKDYKEDKYKCNIGTSIVSMIYNVLKWAKYIAPALIIVFTMLDFIKAIASQNDDDMQKAQSKFVKRLIVAAILFLLPLIINFILQTFGFYSEKCDITDLFSKN